MSFALRRQFSACARRLAPGKNHELLAKYYSPELLKSIEAAERTITPAEWANRKVSKVEFAPHYLDDFSKMDPFWDYKPGSVHAHSTESSIYTDAAPVYNFDKPLQPIGTDLPPGASMPKNFSSKSQTQDLAQGLAKLTGLDPSYIEKLSVRPLIMKRVSNQTGKGKIASFYALVVVGDKNGMVGLGEGKDREEMSRAITKAHWDAVRNLQEIPRYEGRTIVGDIDHRYHGVKLHLRSAKPGFGLRVNHIIYEICECAGVKDLSGKIYKSRNEMNIAKGTIEALLQQRSLEEIALGRGKKVVDVRKTYYSQ